MRTGCTATDERVNAACAARTVTYDITQYQRPVLKYNLAVRPKKIVYLTIFLYYTVL